MVIWALDPLTEENGATRVVPGSHRTPWPRLPSMRQTDPLNRGGRAPHDGIRQWTHRSNK